MAETDNDADFRARPGTRLTLLARAQGHDADAWDRLMSLYTPLVAYWCRSMGLRQDDIEDVLQEVFLAASKGLSEFRHDRPGDTFRGWLRGITRNTLRAAFRRWKKEPSGPGGTDALLKLRDVAEPLIDLADEDPPEQKQKIYQRALDLVRSEFEDRTWQMFWLSTVEEQQVSDIARQFAVTSAAVRKARSRVLHRLKQEVGDVLDGDR